MLLCCLGLFLGLMIGYMFGWPWIFIAPLAGFILGFMVDKRFGKTRSMCCRL